MLAIVDTGPLVAFFDRRERHHRWVVERIAELEAPLLLCEPVARGGAISATTSLRRTGCHVRTPPQWCAQGCIPDRGEPWCAAQVAAKISGQTDVTCGRVHRTHGRNP